MDGWGTYDCEYGMEALHSWTYVIYPSLFDWRGDLLDVRLNEFIVFHSQDLSTLCRTVNLLLEINQESTAPTCPRKNLVSILT